MSEPESERTVLLAVSDTDAGERLDRFVARGAGVSRQQAMALVEAGRVRIGGRRPKKGDRVEPGTTVTVTLPPSPAPVADPDLPLVVLYEDAHVVALDKPAGMNVQPLEPGEGGTLTNAVVARFPDVAGASDEARSPGLLHRLDRDTSGVVLWARTRDAFEALRAQFTARTIVKRYLALVEGLIDEAGEVDLPLAHDPKHPARMLATPYPSDAEALKARPALTRYRPLATGADTTLLEVEIPTGVMHQIRAHFGFAGHPVVGDALYGAHPREGVPRHLLHAWSITFRLPDGDERTVTAPVPSDLRAALESLGVSPP